MTTVNKTKALRVATRCSTIDQFVATFHRFCDETSFFISTLGTRPVGLETPFSIQLDDGKPVLQGLCVVLEAYPTPANRYERPGVRLGLRRLTNDSVPIYKQLLAARGSTSPATIVDGKPPRADATPTPIPMPRPPPIPLVGRPPIDTQKLVSPPAKIDYTPDAKADKTEPNVVTNETKPLPAITRSYSELTSSKPLPSVAVSMPDASKTPPGTSPSLVSLVPSSADAKRRDQTMPRFGQPSTNRQPTPPTPSRTVTPTKTSPPAISRTATPVTKPATAPTTTSSAPTGSTAAPALPTVLPTWAIKPAVPSVSAPAESTMNRPPVSAEPTTNRSLVSAEPTMNRPLVSEPVTNAAPAAIVEPVTNAAPAATVEPVISTPSPSELAVGRTLTPMPVIGRTQTGTQPAVGRTTTGTQPAVGRTLTGTQPAIGRTTTSTFNYEPESIDGRTPGSEFVLPANPLMNLSDESLEGFVDCTIYEETGNFFGAEDGSDALQDMPIAPPRTRTASMIALAEPLAMPTPSPTTPSPDAIAATSSSQLPTFAPFRQTSSLQPFAAPPTTSPPPTYPRTSTSEIPALSRTASGDIPVQSPPASLQYPSYPRTATGDVPSYPRTATGELPSYPQASPTDFPASYPRLSAPYPQVFPNASPEASRWPAPAEHARLPRNLLRRRMYLIAAIAALGVTLLVMIIVAASGGSDDTSTGARAPDDVDRAGAVGEAGDTSTKTQPADDTRTATKPADGSTKAATKPADASTKAAVKPDGSTKAAVKPTDGATKSAIKPADGSTKAAIKPADGSTKAATKPIDGKPIAEADAGDDSAPAPHGLPVVGAGPCRLTVTTTPAGSIIQVDGNAAGPSPLTIANTCQRTRIDVSHPRYQSQQRWVALAADHPGTLDVTLSRPTHAVTVLTLPPGAEVLIDGRRAGTTPTIVQLMGFTSLDLTIEKSGYQTLTKRVYSKTAQDRLFVKLNKK